MLGQTSETWQSSPNSGGYYVTSTTLAANGEPTALNLPGVPAVAYTLDGEGRPVGVSAAGSALVSAAGYNAAGELTGLSFGSGDSDAYGYDAATARMTQYQFNVNGVTDTGALTWNTDGSLHQLQITDNLPGTSDSQTCTYGRDDLGRLASADCGAVWNQAFSYDRYGNIAKSGSQSFGAAYANTKNQISSNINITPSYNADGGLTSDPVTGDTGFAYDAGNRAVEFKSVAVVYDALERAVEAGSNEFLYGPGGTKLAVMSGQSLVRANVQLAGGARALYGAGGLEGYGHVDGLGSVRLVSTPARAVTGSTTYAPFGEPYGTSGSTAPVFTGLHQDIAGGNYDAMFRELSAVQGRWWTPDPIGLGAVDPGDPQSWDRYAYVGNTPMTATDPLGLDGIKINSVHIPLMADESSPDGGCTLDGIATSCSWLMPKLNVGDALACGSLGCGGTVQTSSMTTPLNIEPTVGGWQYVNPYTNEVVTSASELGLPSLGSLGFPGGTDGTFDLPSEQSGASANTGSSAGPNGADTLRTLAAGYAKIVHPLEFLTANGAIAFTGALTVGAGVAVAAGSCGGDGPFALLSCLPGGAAGVAVAVTGLSEIVLAGYFFTHYTVPAFRDWGGQ